MAPLTHALLCAAPCIVASAALAQESVSFRVDPTTIDANMDMFITDSEFEPVGSDGVVFDLLPTNNLVGADRFLLTAANGLHIGGGGGSTLSFDFSVNQPINLISYTLSDNAFAFLGNPVFDISDAGGVLSMSNDVNQPSTTLNFNAGPLSLDAGTTYSFQITAGSAGVQSFLSSWQYELVPAPASLATLGLAGLVATRRRR